MSFPPQQRFFTWVKVTVSCNVICWVEFRKKVSEKINKNEKQAESLQNWQLTWLSQAKALVVGQPVPGEWLR